MKKSNYRSGNETMINYYNKITAKLDEYKFEDLDILRTETSLFINNDIEHFTIKVTITHKAPTADIEKFFNIMEQDILPGYMESFYNTKERGGRIRPHYPKSTPFLLFFIFCQNQRD